MGLKNIAQNDLQKIIENAVTGFGVEITLIDPSSVEYDLKGFANDIFQSIDPDTGQIVSGRVAQISFSLKTLLDDGIGIPIGIADTSIKPWLVRFTDLSGSPVTFKVMSTAPDRGLGIINLFLGNWSND